MPPRRAASSQNSQANDNVPPVEGLPPVSAEGIYRYLGTLADPRPWCGGLFGSVRGVCLFDPAIPWDTTRTLCLYGRVFVMSHIG